MEKTYQILKSGQKSEDRVNFHLIQCDALVQKDVKITSEKELEQVMEDLTLYGRGGTDFRPAFEYIEELRKNGELTNLNGMLYFTDGMGVYPRKNRSIQWHLYMIVKFWIRFRKCRLGRFVI
ncbi:MAG: VWA-like domain-containing protein [Dorea formicigenerans]